MKKTFSVVLTFVLMFTLLFAGCGKDSGTVTIYPVLSTETAKPGDTVQVEVYIDDADWFCSMDFYLSYDAQYVTFVNSTAAAVPDLMSEVINGSDSAGNSYVRFTGLTIRTLDLDKCLLFTAEFTVRDDAPAGEPFFGIAVGEYCKGTDAGGSDYTNIVSEVSEGGEKLTVTVG